MSPRLKFLQILIASLLLIGLLGAPSQPVQQTVVNAHPLIVQMAANNPDQQVAVIVQKSDDSQRAERFVEFLGGKVTKDLHIIHAFAAELSASLALELARSETVRWVSLDGLLERSGMQGKNDLPQDLPENFYLDTMNVRPVWEMGYQGEGIGVAVIDSGISMDRDFSTELGKPKSRIVVYKSFNEDVNKPDDATGHGTHIAGIIGGNGTASGGFYSGIAPKVSLLNLKICDKQGFATESDVLEAMQWVYDNKEQHNIRIVNLSIQSSMEVSFHQSPIDAAAEILWFNGVVVVAASGNWDKIGDYNPIKAAPANDPFIITVGASTENGSASLSDDGWAYFSAWGTTQDGFNKPEILAPGKDIISVLSNSSEWGLDYPEKVVFLNEYIRLSGTSMAASMVTGAVALLLDAEPNLTPDQVKYRLMNASAALQGIPYLDVYAALTTPTTESANTGNVASQLLWTGKEPVAWNSVAWNSVAWNSVAWNSVAWNSVAWNSVAWNSVYWVDD